MSQHSSINLVKQENFNKSFLQCDYEMMHKDQILRTSNSTVGIVFEDEKAKENDIGSLFKPFTHSKTELNANLQKQFNPRTSFLKKRISTSTTYDRQYQPGKGSEKGENPDTVMPVDFDDDDDGGKVDTCQSTPQKNIVIDYRKMRRSGYFLKYGVNYSHNKYVKVVATTNLEFSKTNQVESWLDCLPDDAAYLKDSDEDIMGEHELRSSESNLLLKFSTKEDQLKYMLLRQDDSIEYSSKPASTITHKQLESILETANMKISEYLETSHKAGHFEYEYVSGTFELPASWKTQKQQSVQAIGPIRTSVWEILKNWISSLGSYVTGGHEVPSTVDTSEGSGSQSEEGNVILEPYHGPVKVNGAMIESGTTKPMVRKGIVGSIVEEVKAALQAINVSLRKAPPKSSNPTSIPIQNPQDNLDEDSEIKRLTEEVLHKQNLQKKKSRTVFGLKNTEKIPQYAIHVRRRRQMEMRNRENGGFFRAVNGWIKRKSQNNPNCDLRRQTQNNGRIINRAPFSLGLQHAMNGGTAGRNDVSGTFVTTTFTGITTALRSFGAPLQLTPGIPASNNHDNRHDGQLENYRRRRFNVRQGSSASNPIPTRYQMSRGQERRGRISRNMFTAMSRL